jgi:hypothetical protein
MRPPENNAILVFTFVEILLYLTRNEKKEFYRETKIKAYMLTAQMS